MPETVTKGRYFIGANTSAGFVNYTDEILCGLDRVYIIKGGPGTGKSTLMKRFAAYAEERGHTVERYFCSSDSDSLDGVVLRDAGTGIIDGTAPHCADPKYPGAREEIVNIGRLWDTGLLRGRFDEIKTLCDRKSGLFATVYKYFSVCRSLRTEREKLSDGALRTRRRLPADPASDIGGRDERSVQFWYFCRKLRRDLADKRSARNCRRFPRSDDKGSREPWT